MNKLLFPALVIALLLQAGCASISINSDQADGVDFSAFTSFAMAPPPTTASDTLPGYSEIEAERIQKAISDAFIGQGYELKERGEADLLVAFTINGEPRKDLWTDRSFGTMYTQAATFTATYIVGTLSIDVYSLTDKEMVWHGWGTKEFFADQAGKGDAVIAARDIVARFPPRS